MKNDETLVGLKCMAGEEILCKYCAFSKLEGHGFACKKNVATAAIGVIYRQVAEIERLERIAHSYMLQYGTAADKEVFLKKARAEAIKELAEKLKKDLFYKCGDMNYTETCEARKVIDSLVKEMTEVTP